MRLHTGRVTDAVDASTTHLLLLAPGGGLSPAPVDPAAVLAGVREQGGSAAGLRAMRAGLEEGSLRLVTARCHISCFYYSVCLSTCGW